jgi:type IV secretory pathway TraG/TraD family ATPase VirD4
VSLSKRKAGLVAAAALAASVAATPLSAHEQSFSALESLGAQPLSAAEMDAVNGQAYTLAVAALLAYAAQVQATQPQVATQYTTIAASLSKVTVVTQKYFTTTSCCRILVRR